MVLGITKIKNSYKFLIIFLFSFLFTTVLNKKTFGETFFLVQPSPQCQAYLEVFYSDILEIKNGMFIVNEIESSNIKITKNNFSNYDYHIIFKSDNSSMIISKPDNYQTGTLTIFNKTNPCRSKVTKDNIYASKFSSEETQNSNSDQNENSLKDDSETDTTKDENNDVEKLVLERDLLFEKLVIESSILLEDIKNFLKTPNDFDAIKLGKFFLEFNSLDSKNFNQEFIDKYNEISDYTKQNENFVAYRASLVSERENAKQNLLNENLQFIEHARNKIQDFVISNLDNDNIEEAINFANKIDTNLANKEFQNISNLRDELIIWMGNNNLTNLDEEKAQKEAEEKAKKEAEEKERKLAEEKAKKEAEE